MSVTALQALHHDAGRGARTTCALLALLLLLTVGPRPGRAQQLAFEPVDVEIGPSVIEQVADANRDGYDDIIGFSRLGRVDVLLNDPSGGFEPAVPYTAPGLGHYHQSDLGDVNDDGIPDVALSTRRGDNASGTFGILVSIGDGRYSYVPLRERIQGYVAAAVTDIDRDGSTDLLVSHRQFAFIDIVYGPDLDRVQTVQLSRTQPPEYMLTARLDDDPNVDLITIFNRSVPGPSIESRIIYQVGDGTGSFQETLFSSSAYHTDPIVADLDGDGYSDLVAVNNFLEASDVYIHFSDGRGGIRETSSFTIETLPRSVVAVDFDEDGVLDLAISTHETQEVVVLLGTGAGDGSFVLDQRIPIGGGLGEIKSGDFDGDGHADLVVRNYASGLALLLNRSFDPIATRTGNVNAGLGPITDVVLVNGSAGEGPERRVRLGLLSPFELRVDAPPATPDGRPAPFLLYVWRGEPDRSTVATLPFALGQSCLPMPLSRPSPMLKAIFNNTMRLRPRFGIATHPSMPAPSVVLSRPGGLLRPLTITTQGLIADPGSASPFGASVTNAIVVTAE